MRKNPVFTIFRFFYRKIDFSKFQPQQLFKNIEKHLKSSKFNQKSRFRPKIRIPKAFLPKKIAKNRSFGKFPQTTFNKSMDRFFMILGPKNDFFRPSVRPNVEKSTFLAILTKNIEKMG